MKVIGIIPARYASTRFPGKPLVDIKGKSMIQRVYEQCMKSEVLSMLVVATDDESIRQHVEDFGGHALMTSAEHPSGTDRCSELAESYPEYEIVINIQGDEPLINPGQINLVANCFNDSTVKIASLVKRITTDEELFNENTPKVVLNTEGDALYFSRLPIPFQRSAEKNKWLEKGKYFKHIGIYGYRSQVLSELTSLPVSHLEIMEGLEQLRWIENGYSIRMAETIHESQAIDTPADLEKLMALL